jgi:hypothetical protein
MKLIDGNENVDIKKNPIFRHIKSNNSGTVKSSPDESYFRNLSCTLNLISTFLYPRNEVVGGYTGFTMSVRPSVDKSYVVR